MRGADRSSASRPWALTRAPELLLAAAALCSGVLLVTLASQMTWRYDDWFVILVGSDWSLDALFNPQYEHIILARNVIYKAMLGTFGLGSQVPFAILSISTFLLSAVLLFVYLRRRVGDWVALIATTVVLFLGSAWEDLLWPVQIVHFGSMCCGLGALLALEREDRFGDRLACVLITVCLTFFTLGFVFIAGAMVDIALRRGQWWRRIYIAAVPLFLYGLWYLGWGQNADTSLSWHDFGTAPLFMLDAMAAGLAALLGLASGVAVDTVGSSLDWGRPLLPVALLLAAWRLTQLDKIPRTLWIVLAIGLTSWFLGGLAQQQGRPADASRYQYPTVFFILMIAAEMLRGVRISRTAVIVTAVVAAGVIMGNVTHLVDAYKIRKAETEQERAAFAALEMAKGTVPDEFELKSRDPNFEYFVSQTLPTRGYFPGGTGAPGEGAFLVEAGRYLDALEDWGGSPAYSSRELLNSPNPARETADRVVADALGVKLEPSEAPLEPGRGQAPILTGPPEALVGRQGSCLRLDSTGTSPPLLELPLGGATLAAGEGGGFQVRLRRFASTSLPIDLGTLGPGTAAMLEIPADRSKQPWKLSLDGAGEVEVCGLGG